METFITDVSTTRTNIAIASRMASLRSSLASAGAPTADLAVTADHHPGSHALPAGGLRVLRSAKATSGWADQPGPAPPHRPHRVRRYLSRDIPLSRRRHLESPAIGRPRSGIMTRSWVARYYGTWAKSSTSTDGRTSGDGRSCSTPVHRVERNGGETGSHRALRARAGSRRGRRGRPVLQAPPLGAADSECRDCPGVRGVLFEVPEACMSPAAAMWLTQLPDEPQPVRVTEAGRSCQAICDHAWSSACACSGRRACREEARLGRRGESWKSWGCGATPSSPCRASGWSRPASRTTGKGWLEDEWAGRTLSIGAGRAGAP